MKLQPTIETLKKHTTELQKKFSSCEVIAIPNVSTTQFSIARYYGGIKYNGQSYTYNPVDDSLIRDDVLQYVVTLQKQKSKRNNKSIE